MRSDITKTYVIFLLPAVVVPTVFHLIDPTISPSRLFQVGLLLPIMMLATKGLATFFPPANFRDRPVGPTIEYAVLQGLLFAGFIVLIVGVSFEVTLRQVLMQFAVSAVLMSGTNLIGALRGQRRLRRDPAGRSDRP